MAAPTQAAHAVVDWGTSSFRLWLLDRDGAVLGSRRSDEGLTRAAGLGFETVLEGHLAALGAPDGLPVMMCGMVGARAGWVEAAYLDAPVPLAAVVERATPVPSGRRPLRILPGIAQRDPDHPDVIRGEETQLLALAARGWSGLACLPGTHSKWVQVRDGAIDSFATFMTGELYQLLRAASILAPAVEQGGEVQPEDPAFADGVAAALAQPEQGSNLLFALRARWLLLGARPSDLLARLSGLVIGLELAGARRRFGSLDGTALVAAGATAALYGRALGLAGAAGITLHDAEDCVRIGLHSAAMTAFFEPGGGPR